MREQNPFHLTLKRLGYGVLALFSILVVIGMVLDEDVQNASFREVMRGVGIAFAVIFLLLVYALIIYRIMAIGMGSRNNFSRIYCYGFAASFFLYVAVNMSMVLGLLPIVGAPLPIMSYGGSSMLAMMIGLGIVMSCKVNNQEAVH